MSGALECWSGRPSTDEDTSEHVLMPTEYRSEAFRCAASAPTSPSSKDGSVPPKRWQRLGRNFAGAISALKNSLNLESFKDQKSSDRLVWGGVVRNLTRLYPGSQLPEKLIANIRRHFDSLPNSYAQVGLDVKDVLLHIHLIEQATAEDYPAIHIHEVPEFAGADGVLFRLTFASMSPISWPSMSGALDTSSISCNKIQIFEKKGLTLGIVTLLVYSGSEKLFKARVESAVRSSVKKPKNGSVTLHFGFCGCQEENGRTREDEEEIAGKDNICENGVSPESKLPNPIPESSLVILVDEWQTIKSGGDEIRKWLLSCDQVELLDRTGPNSFKGVFRGKKVCVKKFGGCERGNAYEIEVKRDLMELMSCGHKNILQLHGICMEENHGMCLVTKLMRGGSVHDALQKNKRIPFKDVVRIAMDVAEGLMFMNDHGVAYRDLNTQRILLDKQGNACLGDMGIVNACKSSGEVMEYQTAGYRWLAPEIIAGDPETVSENWMSNVYSFGMVIWEMVTGETPYCSYSPVQAAVEIAACGLRPEIPNDCPQFLKSLMSKCWHNNPIERPKFSEIIATLSRQNTR